MHFDLTQPAAHESGRRADRLRGYAVNILGTRGIPASHGGFETFAQNLAPYLVERGWEVAVYCQVDGRGPIEQDRWRGVTRWLVPVRLSGAAGTIEFDFKAVRHASRRRAIQLTLGYNTAGLTLLNRLRGHATIMNMDGLEWRRAKWRAHEKAFLYLNERLGCLWANHLVADHPEIAAHLRTRVRAEKISMISYGADEVRDADEGDLAPLGLTRNGYALIIARPEPENSILPIVQAFSRRPRPYKLVVLGKYSRESTAYQRAVLEAAGDGVMFPGAVYTARPVHALRRYARFYIHGHTVGGTNPSLVEALGAGSPIVAHENRFNRWVAGDAARYFTSDDDCAAMFDRFVDGKAELQQMSDDSRRRFQEAFTWDCILPQYERLLAGWGERFGCWVEPRADAD